MSTHNSSHLARTKKRVLIPKAPRACPRINSTPGIQDGSNKSTLTPQTNQPQLDKSNTKGHSDINLIRILAISVPDAKKPSPPNYTDCTNVIHISKMRPADPSSFTDVDMIVRLVQSGAIEDAGYVWADATELQKWLVQELVLRLNHFLQADFKDLPEGAAVPPLIREMKNATERMAPLVKWCKVGRQRGIEFRHIPTIVKQLKKFNFNFELSIYDLMLLVAEAKGRADTVADIDAEAILPADPMIFHDQDGDTKMEVLKNICDGGAKDESAIKTGSAYMTQLALSATNTELVQGKQRADRSSSAPGRQHIEARKRKSASETKLVAWHNELDQSPTEYFCSISEDKTNRTSKLQSWECEKPEQGRLSLKRKASENLESNCFKRRRCDINLECTLSRSATAQHNIDPHSPCHLVSNKNDQETISEALSTASTTSVSDVSSLFSAQTSQPSVSTPDIETRDYEPELGLLTQEEEDQFIREINMYYTQWLAVGGR